MFEDKVLKHKRAEGYYRRHAALGNVDGAWKNFVESNKVQDPRPMDQAKYIPRHEMDNMNTKDLEQAPDSYLKPGQTLEKDFDVNFRKANSEGGRTGYADKNAGTLVKKLVPLDITKLGKGNLKNAETANKILYDLYGKDVVDNHAKKWAEKSNLEKNRIRPIKIQNLDEMESSNDRANFRRKFREDIAKGYGEFNPDRKSSAAQKRYADHVKRAKTGTFETIVFDAFGRDKLKGTKTPNPSYDLPKLDAIHKNIDKYNILKEYLETNFDIITELDHPLDKNTIRTIMNASASDLANVNILEQNLNTGFKKQLNNKYFQAVQSGDLNKKSSVEAIAKKFNLKIGSVPDNQFKKGQLGPFEFNKIDKGVASFETLNIEDEMLKSLKDAANLDTEWGQYVKDNPGVFKDAGFDLKTLKKPKNVKNIADNIIDIEAKIKELGGKEKLNQLLFKGGGTTAEKGLIQKIVSGGGKFALSMLNPAELIKLKNLIGPGALGIMAAFEAGVVTDDVLRMGKPLDESLASNWLFKSFMPHSEEFAKQKNLLQSGKLTGSEREYALEMMKMEQILKEDKRIKMMESTQLTDQGGMGMIDGSPMIPQEEIDNDRQKLMERFGRVKDYVLEEGSARQLENEAAMTEKEATEMAKKKFSPLFGNSGTPLVNKAPRPKNMTRGPMTEKGKMPLDFSIPGITNYKTTYTPSNKEISDYYQTLEKPRALDPGEGTLIRMGMGGEGLYGTQDKFAVGGLAGLMKKYNDKR